jgi:hypothetical protein
VAVGGGRVALGRGVGGAGVALGGAVDAGVAVGAGGMGDAVGASGVAQATSASTSSRAGMRAARRPPAGCDISAVSR